jgi:hypothetical protein
MVTPNLGCMRWSELVDRGSIGKSVRISYLVDPKKADFDILEIVGTGHIYGQHVLIVRKLNSMDDDIYIVMREGIGRDWNMYEMREEIEL